MLVKYVSFFVLLLITVSCASSSDDGENFLLHYCPDIPADDAGLALTRASENGHTTIVERLFHYFPDIPADRVGLALTRAFENGHTTIVEHLLEYCPDIPADDAGLALTRASENGHTTGISPQ
jgi:ankyrin repeat protein